jgi:hypothetical protein
MDGKKENIIIMTNKVLDFVSLNYFDLILRIF